MFRVIHNWIVSFLKRRLEPSHVESVHEHMPVRLEPQEVVELLIENSNLTIDEPVIYHPEANTTLLVVANVKFFMDVLEADLGCKLEDLTDYKVVVFNGKYCSLGAYKYMNDNKVDKAIIDLIYKRTSLAYENEYYNFNGIDLSESIKKIYPGVEIILYSSLPIDKVNGKIPELNNTRLTGRLRKLALHLSRAMNDRAVQLFVNTAATTQETKTKIRDLIADNYKIGTYSN